MNQKLDEIDAEIDELLEAADEATGARNGKKKETASPAPRKSNATRKVAAKKKPSKPKKKVRGAKKARPVKAVDQRTAAQAELDEDVEMLHHELGDAKRSWIQLCYATRNIGGLLHLYSPSALLEVRELIMHARLVEQSWDRLVAALKSEGRDHEAHVDPLQSGDVHALDQATSLLVDASALISRARGKKSARSRKAGRRG